MQIRTGLIVSLLAVALIFAFAPRSGQAAEDGAAIYKAKCAACHGADAKGKPAVKAPSLVSDEAKKMPDDELANMIAEGGKQKKAAHAFAKKGVTAEQVKALVAYIRELQKQ